MRRAFACVVGWISTAAAFRQPVTWAAVSRVRPPTPATRTAAARETNRDTGDAPKPTTTDTASYYYRGMLTSAPSEADAAKDMLTPTLKLAGGASVVLVALVAAFLLANTGVPPASAAESAAAGGFEPRGVQPVDFVVFAIGTVPFVWAANEFWRRIAVGATFGTGSDAVVIDPQRADDDTADEDQLRRFGGRRVLGKDAIVAAWVLMAIAGGSIALVGLSAVDLVARSSP
mmetsp:Transcript_1815/g.7017  ORF Transcript_1815/g.7017 Transcript_1815/m.7017 type:complete len:231 (-) Transcript_1815:125-817(-)